MIQFNNTQAVYYPAKLLNPPVHCPSCHQPVRGLGGSRIIDAPKVSQANHADLPPHQRTAVVAWTLLPCYCQVDQYWASGLAAEMKRREKGDQPRDVDTISALSKNDRKEQIEKELKKLYQRQQAAVMTSNEGVQGDIERAILKLIDELARIVPGAHNTVPPISLSKEVLAWAEKNKYPMPRGQSPVDTPMQVQLKDIQTVLALDPAYEEKTAGFIGELAHRIYQQLVEHAKTGAPVEPLVRDVVAKIIPFAEDFLPVKRASGPAIDSSPAEQYLAELNARRKRRIVRLPDEHDDS